MNRSRFSKLGLYFPASMPWTISTTLSQTGVGTPYLRPASESTPLMAMVSQAAGRVRVKASGGIRTLEDARAYLKMGAERLGVGFSIVPKLVSAEAEGK